MGRRRSPKTSSKNTTLVFMGNMTSPNVTIRRTGVGRTTDALPQFTSDCGKMVPRRPNTKPFTDISFLIYFNRSVPFWGRTWWVPPAPSSCAGGTDPTTPARPKPRLWV